MRNQASHGNIRRHLFVPFSYETDGQLTILMTPFIKFGMPSKRKYVVKTVLPYILVSPDTIRNLCRLTRGPGEDIVYAADEAIPAQLKQGPFAAALGKPIVCFADARGLPEFVEEDCGYGVLYMNMEALTGRD